MDAQPQADLKAYAERLEHLCRAQAVEITKLRNEVARLTEGASAYATLSDIHRNRDLPESVRVKAAIGCLPHELPKLQSVPPAIDLPCEEIEDLATLVHRRRARQDALQGRDIEVFPNGQVFLLEPDGNGSTDGGGSDDSGSSD
jgi:hypothetical protein